MIGRSPGIRPRDSLGRRLDIAFRLAVPGASTALLLLLGAGPLGIPGQAQLQGALALGAVFFWSLVRPVSMPPLLVFGLGLLADLLGYGPLGVNLLLLLGAHGLGVAWRHSLPRQGFLLVWLAYCGVAAAAAALQWALTALLGWRLLPAAPALFQALLSAGLYPPLTALLGRLDRGPAEPAGA